MSVQTIMTADANGTELVEYARNLAAGLVKDNLTRGQIRTIFTEVRQIENIWFSEERKQEAVRRLSMLKPKLAYQTARTPALNKLSKDLSEAIGEVVKAPDKDKDERFKRLIDFFEAVLAYHRSEGGRN